LVISHGGPQALAWVAEQCWRFSTVVCRNRRGDALARHYVSAEAYVRAVRRMSSCSSGKLDTSAAQPGLGAIGFLSMRLLHPSAVRREAVSGARDVLSRCSTGGSLDREISMLLWVGSRTILWLLGGPRIHPRLVFTTSGTWNFRGYSLPGWARPRSTRFTLLGYTTSVTSAARFASRRKHSTRHFISIAELLCSIRYATAFSVFCRGSAGFAFHRSASSRTLRPVCGVVATLMICDRVASLFPRCWVFARAYRRRWTEFFRFCARASKENSLTFRCCPGALTLPSVCSSS